MPCDFVFELYQLSFFNWNIFVVFHRCTRKEKCERSSEPRRFTSDIKQCVRLSVHPSNISVSQYSVTVSINLLFLSEHRYTDLHHSHRHKQCFAFLFLPISILLLRCHTIHVTHFPSDLICKQSLTWSLNLGN